MISSDPYLSSFRPKLSQYSHIPLTEEAKELIESTSSADRENVEFVDVGSLSDWNLLNCNPARNIFNLFFVRLKKLNFIVLFCVHSGFVPII